MDTREYEVLQKMLTDKLNDRMYLTGSNSGDGWEDAILYVKSMLHCKFKPKEKENEMQTVEREIANNLMIGLKNDLQKYVKGEVDVAAYTDRHNRCIIRVDITHKYYNISFNIDHLYDKANGAWTSHDLALIILKKYRKRINNLFFT